MICTFCDPVEYEHNALVQTNTSNGLQLQEFPVSLTLPVAGRWILMFCGQYTFTGQRMSARVSLNTGLLYTNATRVTGEEMQANSEEYFSNGQTQQFINTSSRSMIVIDAPTTYKLWLGHSKSAISGSSSRLQLRNFKLFATRLADNVD